jgi:hypothetical protein
MLQLQTKCSKQSWRGSKPHQQTPHTFEHSDTFNAFKAFLTPTLQPAICVWHNKDVSSNQVHKPVVFWRGQNNWVASCVCFSSTQMQGGEGSEKEAYPSKSASSSDPASCMPLESHYCCLQRCDASSSCHAIACCGAGR